MDGADPQLAPNIAACTTVKTREKKAGNPIDHENRLRKQEWRRYADARSMNLAQMC